jgi:lipopolysaccharide export system protein LptA
MQLSRISLAIAVLLHTPISWAELNDRNQPMQIEADQVIMNEALQTSTFTGNVRVNQGTLQIRGDKIIVSQDKQGNKICKIYGSTASFRQKREGLNEYVEGYGERIEYDTLNQILDIYGQARLKREQDFIRGEHIHYNAQNEIFEVNAGATVKGVPHPRVRAVLQPHPKEQPTLTSPTEKK